MPDITIDPGAYPESYVVSWRAGKRRVRRGACRGRATVLRGLPAGATVWVDVGGCGLASTLSFRVDRSSGIVVGLTKPAAAEVVGGATLRLRAVPVRIDPGEFRGEYRPSFRVRGRGTIPASRGALETHLVPDMAYRLGIGRPSPASVDAFVEFRLDRDGKPRAKWIDPPAAADAKGATVRLRTRLRQVHATFPANVGGYDVRGSARRHLVRGVPVAIVARRTKTPPTGHAVSVGRVR
jgi:hypothetical protein